MFKIQIGAKNVKSKASIYTIKKIGFLHI